MRNAPGGERVRVAIAMVDEGILNITRYESPNPVDYFFGRRALGVDMRDDYGRLLNPNLGAPATARQGGDSLGGEGLTVVPTRTVAIVSDIVEVRGGRAIIPVDIPDFNGTLRLMAVAWSETALGQDAEQIIVRDPVVAELILPRFLAPGDEAQGALNIDNVEGPNGAYTVTVGGSPDGANRSATAALHAQPRSAPNGADPDHGRPAWRWPRSRCGLKARKASRRWSEATTSSRARRSCRSRSRTTEPQAAGASWRAPADALARFQPSAQALISFSNLAGIDPAPLLDALYRYPYGCTEQLTIGGDAAALLQHARRRGEPRSAIRASRRRVQEAATQLLDRQGPDGAFGLWSAGDGYASPWLGAYATDFLLRAQRAGYAVPRQPMQQAYAALRRVARLNDFGSVNYEFEAKRADKRQP